MQIIEKSIHDIKPYEKNPRLNKEAVKYVAESIEQFGFKVPIIIDKQGVIIAGHTRLLAAKELGLEKVPCIMADDLNEEQVKAFRLADNRVAEFSEWDMGLLSQEIECLDLDMTVFGFDIAIDEPNDVEVIEDNYEVEPPKEPKAKYGQIYQLGRHRLMCGDSTKEEDVVKLMNGEKADMVFTDPPYGMKKEKDGVTNDNLNFDDLLEFNKKWIPLTFNNLKENGSWYCWGIDEPLMDIYSYILKPMAKKNEITFRNLITWDKGHGQGQLSSDFRMYPIADEKCLFVMCGVQGFNNNADNYFEAWEPLRNYLVEQKKIMGWNDADITKICGVTTVARHAFGKSQWELPTEENYKKMQKAAQGDAFKREYYSTRAYFDNTHDNMNNVWHFNRAGKEERTEHATPKPIALCSRGIKSSSRENEIVLDVFGGSGSTLIASEQLNRKCYMMECEPKWIDVIIDRWEKYTGKKAVLLND